ncbi:nuclear exosome regulator NRDE2-like isoform X2 [Dreissena polymorpha]|uniref:nuclear exosome regulator NRDE2-like isoform X2 n=1 Tax=Dreissena polymorpha TaxID=45954 RepID=UPI002263C6C1|nr:nuclear exosome regulator NRDE2-like isoform X2 [Dreissena polymorpha]
MLVGMREDQISTRTMSDKLHTGQNRTSLFPSAVLAGVSSKNESGQENVPDWLVNKSFTKTTEEKLVEFQNELKKLQGHDREEAEPVSLFNSSKVSEQVKLSRTHYLSYPGQHLKQTEDLSKHLHGNRQHDRANDSQTSPGRKRTFSDKSSTSSDSEERYSRTERKKKKKKSYHSRDSDYERGSKADKHKRKKKHKKHKAVRKVSKSPSTERTVPGLLPSKHIFLDDVEDIAPEHPFKLERVPDMNSLAYGSLYSGHLASYRAKCQQCLGSSGSSVVWIKSVDLKKRKGQSSRYYDKENRKLLRGKAQQSIVNFDKNVNSEIPGAYISVDFSPCVGTDVKTAMEGCGNIRETILDKSTSLYVQGLGKKVEETMEETEIELDEMRMKVGEFNRKLRAEPKNVKLWLEFVQFQNEIAYETVRSQDAGCDKKVTERGMLEKKLSIIEKALEHNPGHIDLLLARIELNAEIQDSVKINKEIEQLLFVHPANKGLWKYYLEFNQSRLTLFSVSKQCRLYHKCLKAMLGIHSGVVQTHSVPANLGEDITEIFLQYCYFLKQVGFKERAVASFQALMEFNFFCPPSLKSVALETKISAFEVFWENDSAKLGTKCASGWKNNLREGQQNADGEPANSFFEEKEEEIIGRNNPKYKTWLEIELLREEHHWLPWKPNTSQGETEDSCDDPERMVVFDDIRPILFEVPEKHHYHLVLAFIEFLGYRSHDCGPSIFAKSVEALHDKSGLKVSIGKICKVQSLNDDNSDTLYIVNTFAVTLLRQLIPCFSNHIGTSLTLLALQIELSRFRTNNLTKNDKKEIRKIMKNALKEDRNRNNLEVWSMYVNLERMIGKTGEAGGIVETALSMYSGKSIEQVNSESYGLIALCTTYCEILLGIDLCDPTSLLARQPGISMAIKKKVMGLLCNLMEGKKFSPSDENVINPASVLKTTSKFVKSIDSAAQMFSQTSDECCKQTVLQLTWCYAVFCLSRTDLKSCLDAIESASENISSYTNDKTFRKVFYTFQLKLIVYYMSVASTPLSTLRVYLDRALTDFPEEAVFLSLFLDVERKSKISGRMNRYFDRLCRSLVSPVPLLIAVQHLCDVLEKRNTEDDTVSPGLVHRARNWLELGLSQTSLQHSPRIWRLYLTLENMVASGRQKGIFYRAVQQCPWVKSIYLDGVKYLGDSELQEIVDLMTEKEIRVQIPVEELDILISP